jgi:membrane protease YdiL (CAAX protease family)
MPFQENPLLLLLVFIPIAISLGMWGAALRNHLEISLMAARREPLPRRTAVLFGAALLVTLLQMILVPLIVRAIRPDFSAPPSEFNASRALFGVRVGVGVDAAVLLAGLLAIAMRPRDDRRWIGFHRDQPRTQLRYGLIGFGFSLFPVYLLVLAVSPFKKPEHLHGMLQLIQAQPSFEVLAWTIGSAVIAAPLAEEMLYRVLFQQGLIALGHPPRLVILGVAAFFCLNHANPHDPASFLQTLPLLPLALILGWVVYLRNSFLACVVIHMLFNAFNILISLVSLI